MITQRQTAPKASDDEARYLAASEIVALAQRRGSRELWVNDVGSVTWAEFGIVVEAARHECAGHRIKPGSVVEVVAEERLSFLAWVFAAAAAGAVVAPLRRADAATSPLRNFVFVDWRVSDGRLQPVRAGTTTPASERLLGLLRTRRHPGLILATGGTTGTPKLLLHDLSLLLSNVRVRDTNMRRILPLMRFDHIGGLDMAWRALGAAHVLVAPPPEITPALVAATIQRHRVNVLPATPSFLNLLLLSEAHKTNDLSTLAVVPYGAEPMPAALLKRLRIAFPNVEFVQRFGTSETGALPVRESPTGLFLDRERKDFSWKVVEGELWIKSPSRALGYLSGDPGGFDTAGWFKTGDQADVHPDGSVQIQGRRSELINVGGEKVLPEEVESALTGHPMVGDCRVGPSTNAVLGQVVAAEVVWLGPEQDALEVKRILVEFAWGLLARHKLPTVVRLVKSIDWTSTLKKSRRVPL